MSQKDESLDTFDKESFKAEVENAIPQVIAEMCDLLERPPPRVSRKDRREMAEDMAWGIEVSIPHIKTLEEIGGNLGQLDKGYHTLEEWFRTWLRRVMPRARLKPGEDVFDYLLRKYWAALQPPYQLKRLKQYRVTRAGIEQLIDAVVRRPGGIDEARGLIEEFERKHLKEYVRGANALNARIHLYRNVNLSRMTSQNVTRVTDVYGTAAAAFEKRLRLLVGLNHVARGEAKAYDDLRKLGYNELLQAVDSPGNPLLHSLKGVVDRHVRNAVMHGGVSSSPSKGVVRFADYSPRKGVENEVEWPMNKFIRQTRNLYLTILAVDYLEQLFNFACAYYTFAAFRYLRANPPSSSSVDGAAGTAAAA